MLSDGIAAEAAQKLGTFIVCSKNEEEAGELILAEGRCQGEFSSWGGSLRIGEQSQDKGAVSE